MKLIATLILCTLTSLSSMWVWADQASSKQQLITELMKVLDADAMAVSMQLQIGAMMRNMEKEISITDDEKAIFAKHSKSIAATMREAVRWEKIDPVISEIYERLFTEQELADILAFYKTPSGQSMLTKLPIAMQESMDVGQYMLEEAMPKLRKIALALDAELKIHRKQ